MQSSILATDNEAEPLLTMSKSGLIKTKGHSSDVKSLRSLNVSMVETFLSSNEAKSRFTDDLDDDEFVVVPDCFDLTKKWRPHEIDSELRELKKSFMEGQGCNNEKKEMDSLNGSVFEYKSADIANKLDELTESVKKLSTNDLIMLNSTESNTSSIKNESSLADLTVDISVKSPVLSQSQPDFLTYNPVTIVENSPQNNSTTSEVNSINLIPLVPAVEKNKSTELSPKQISSDDKKLDHLSTFDLMKNAFSNLQGPSYVNFI